VKFIIKFFGNSGTIPLEYEREYAYTHNIITDVERTLAHYHPVYYTAAIWRYLDNGEIEIVAEFKSKIKVERVISSSSKMTDAEIEAHDRAEYEKDMRK